jgi:NAD(P)-dependent dehydrogenase (short-subunit alcohol dehydrogenase family)
MGAVALWRVVRRLAVRPLPLRGRAVLITGASRGLGLELARVVAAEGAQLVLCARSEIELGRAVAELRAEHGGIVHGIVADVTSPEAATRVVGATLDVLGRLDVLINNAGVITVGPERHMTLADYNAAMDTHFWGPLRFIHAALPALRAAGAASIGGVSSPGRIVNVASIGGRIGVPHLTPYCASKFALCGLSEALGAELAGEGLRVTTATPGLMRTGSPRHALFKGRHRSEFAWFSIADALPGLSVSSRAAAREIIAAMREGRSVVTPSRLAALGVQMHGLAPRATGALLGRVNAWLLPKPDGSGARAHRGADSGSAWSPSWLTTLSERAAARNNELHAL